MPHYLMSSSPLLSHIYEPTHINHIHLSTLDSQAGWWPEAAFQNALDNTHTQGSSGTEPLDGLSWSAAVAEQNRLASMWTGCLLRLTSGGTRGLERAEDSGTGDGWKKIHFLFCSCVWFCTQVSPVPQTNVSAWLVKAEMSNLRPGDQNGLGKDSYPTQWIALENVNEA